jgi:hypothetical protein
MARHCIIFNDSIDIKRRTAGAYKVANLLQNLGWKTNIVDWISDWSDEDLFLYLDKIVNEKTLLFAISYTWLKPQWAKEFITKVKNRYPNIKFIAGGQQPFQYDINVDIMLFGYVENVIEAVVDYLFHDKEKPKGIHPNFSPNSFLIDCNNSYPAMGMKNYSIKYNVDDFVQSKEVLAIELSRGCRFKCAYCNYAFLGIKEDTSTSKNLLKNELIENYKKWGVINYIIADDTFNDRDSKIEMLAEVVEELPFQPNFTAFIRIDLLITRPRQLELLSRARVWAHFYGIETFHEQAGKAVKKGMNPEKIKKGLLNIEKYMLDNLGLYRGTVGMIAGLPYETPNSWRNSQEWFEKNWYNNSWFWWPLEISTDKNNKTLSTFSNDWKKFGYREIKNQELLDKINSSILKNKYDQNVLIWEADWATKEQAIDFVQETLLKRRPMKLSNFAILSYWHDVKNLNKHILDLDYISNDTVFFRDNIGINLVNEYIKQKIKSVN